VVKLQPEMTTTISRNLSRRLERLEACLMPTSGPRLMVINVIATATGEVIEGISMPWMMTRATAPTNTTMAAESV
jgi:hypothetical protein